MCILDRRYALLGVGEAPTARTLARGSGFFNPMLWLCLLLAGPLYANSGNLDDLIEKYESLLLFRSADYERSDAAKAVFEDSLSTRFQRAVCDTGSIPFERRSELAYFVSNVVGDTDETDEEREAREDANRDFHNLFNRILPTTLAYAYRTPGTSDEENPYYPVAKSERVAKEQ